MEVIRLTLIEVLMWPNKCKRFVPCCHPFKLNILTFVLTEWMFQWLIMTIICIINCTTLILRCIILLIHHFKIQQQPNKSLNSQGNWSKAKTAIARLERNSIASPNSSIFQNECATTTSNNNALSQLNSNEQSQVCFRFNNNFMPSAQSIQICVFNIFATYDWTGFEFTIKYFHCCQHY